MDFAINCLLVRPGRPRYPVLVHRAAALLHASFRRHLTMPPLRFANPSPSSGWIEDFHLQAVDQCSAHNKKPQPEVEAFRLGPFAVDEVAGWPPHVIYFGCMFSESQSATK